MIIGNKSRETLFCIVLKNRRAGRAGTVPLKAESESERECKFLAGKFDACFEGQYRRVFRPITVLIFLFLAFSISSPLFADIEFSDFLFPLEKTSYFGWKGFQDEMPNLFKKAKTVTIESGNTFFYGSGGRLQLELKIDQTLNPEHTFRTITLTFTFPGDTEIKLSTLTQGHDLSKLPLEELRMGKLPFFPQKNESLTRIDFLVTRINNFSIVIHRDSENTIQADFFSNNNSQYFLHYSETSTDTYREFTYTLLEEELFGEQQTLKVSKCVNPHMILGTEEYFINDIPVSAKEYLDAFSSLQGFIFGMWQVQFQQFIQHINF